MGLYEKVDQLCKSKGIEKSNLGEVLGIKLTKGTVSKWQKGAMPRAGTLKAMADYFGVTVEYLTNDDAVNVQTVQDNHGIIGSTHAPVTIINGSERKLSEQEIALLNIFEKLSVVDQSKLIVFAEELSAK